MTENKYKNILYLNIVILSIITLFELVMLLSTRQIRILQIDRESFILIRNIFYWFSFLLLIPNYLIVIFAKNYASKISVLLNTIAFIVSIIFAVNNALLMYVNSIRSFEDSIKNIVLIILFATNIYNAISLYWIARNKKEFIYLDILSLVLGFSTLLPSPYYALIYLVFSCIYDIVYVYIIIRIICENKHPTTGST